MTSRRRFLRDALGIVAGAGLLGLPVWSWLANREPVARFARTMMGTKVEIVLVGLTPAAAAAAAELAFAEMARVERRLTIFDSRSALSRLNAGAGSGPVPIDPDLSAVLTRAEAIRNVSGKVFTPAALPLTRLWDPSRRRIPDPAAVERAREAVQRARLILAETGGAALGPGTQLDLGGIAKGYAVDLAVGALRRRGVESGIVDAGGDLRLLGSRMGRPWPVGIPDPSHPELIARVLNLRDAAVAPSGDY
jgi:thiamine biosynthesis lipoprotein